MSGRDQPRKRFLSWLFGLLRLATVLAVLYAIGLTLFLSKLSTFSAGTPAADGIVALTGAGGRLGPAVALLERGAGERLLITGVNPLTSKSQLRELLNGGIAFDCCADLDFQAEDTHGNAGEAARWARAHGYRSLIVVTADYHMPRSLMEFSARMPDVELLPYPVGPEQPDRSIMRRLPRLHGEFVKYLASSVRISLGGNGVRS